MAKHKRRKKRFSPKSRKHRRAKRAVRRQGLGRSVSSGTGFSLDTIPKLLLAAAIMRLLSGAVFYYFRGLATKPGLSSDDLKKIQDNFKKAKIIVPVIAVIAIAKKWVPQLPGLLPIAVASAFHATVENTDLLRDTFDLIPLDKDAATAATAAEMLKPKKGMYNYSGSARSWQQTRNQLMNMHSKNGIFVSTGRPAFNGISVRRQPLGFNGRDVRGTNRFS